MPRENIYTLWIDTKSGKTYATETRFGGQRLTAEEVFRPSDRSCYSQWPGACFAALHFEFNGDLFWSMDKFCYTVASESKQSAAAEPATKMKQQSLSHFVVRPACQKRLNYLLLRMTVKDMQPFAIVSDEGFREFLAVLDPRTLCRTRRPPAMLPGLVSWWRWLATFLRRHWTRTTTSLGDFSSSLMSVAYIFLINLEWH